ncbi:lipoyl domain-containing protein [Aquamicrobium terrae]|uniref:Pyruvate/2-oxoglutarate dehydrogenase complex dihydrolipoamide acyltransferase (E2) component n=1 Tax=Aquamicrobium terrae TaxID=1324945 RepID=A0ABV2N5I2_9HYPH
MAVDVTIPADLWDGDQEAVITTWLAGDGAAVEADSLIAEIMVEKIQYEIRAPADGVITFIKQADDVVAKGDVIARIG